jgi:Lysylphosphatidylglycerol synthase TM region
MRDAANGLADALERAATGLAEAVGGAAPGWLGLAVGLHLANQVARGRGWCAVVDMARTGGPRLRRRDAVAAWVAGAGMGGVVSARGGDAVRIVLLRQRLPDTGYSLLAGTLVAEAAGETAIGLGAVALLVVSGMGPAPAVDDPAFAWIVLGTLVAVTTAAFLRSRWSGLRRLIEGVARGCAALREPRAYARGVLPWQLTSRMLRAASLVCFLVSFGLPATPEAVALVMLAQGGGRALPLAPASVAATVAILAIGLPSATGAAVGPGAVAAFVVGMSTTLTLVGVLLAAGIAARMIGLRRRSRRSLLVAAARARPAAAAPAVSAATSSSDP